MRRTYWSDVLRTVASARLLPHRWRPRLLRASGASVGSKVLMYGGATFHGSGKLIIKDDVFVNQSCHFDVQASITIEIGARIGDHVRLITSGHVVGPSERRAGPGTAEPIVLGRGVWIGSGACILPGVTIADGCIIGAGAVVTRSTERDGVYVGVPAKRIKNLA